jgi:molecular chaperone GrpE
VTNPKSHHHHSEPKKTNPEEKSVMPEAEKSPVEESQAAEPKKAEAAADSTAKLQAELQDAKDRELRCRAELENYRKRSTRELKDRLRYANMDLFRDLLPVLDNVERAIQAGEKSADAAALLDGFRIVQQQLENALKQHHCERIEALHTPFDPNVHHAVLQQPSDEHPANTVLMVTQNGYQLHDRVVRPSQVIVSKGE